MSSFLWFAHPKIVLGNVAMCQHDVEDEVGGEIDLNELRKMHRSLGKATYHQFEPDSVIRWDLNCTHFWALIGPDIKSNEAFYFYNVRFVSCIIVGILRDGKPTGFDTQFRSDQFGNYFALKQEHWAEHAVDRDPTDLKVGDVTMMELIDALKRK